MLYVTKLSLSPLWKYNPYKTCFLWTAQKELCLFRFSELSNNSFPALLDIPEQKWGPSKIFEYFKVRLLQNWPFPRTANFLPSYKREMSKKFPCLAILALKFNVKWENFIFLSISDLKLNVKREMSTKIQFLAILALKLYVQVWVRGSVPFRTWANLRQWQGPPPSGSPTAPGNSDCLFDQKMSPFFVF